MAVVLAGKILIVKLLTDGLPQPVAVAVMVTSPTKADCQVMVAVFVLPGEKGFYTVCALGIAKGRFILRNFLKYFDP